MAKIRTFPFLGPDNKVVFQDPVLHDSTWDGVELTRFCGYFISWEREGGFLGKEKEDVLHAEIACPVSAGFPATDGGTRTSRNPEALAKEFEPSGQTIRNLVMQAEREEVVRRDGPSPAAAGSAVPSPGEQATAYRTGHSGKSHGLVRSRGRLATPVRLRVHEIAPSPLSGRRCAAR